MRCECVEIVLTRKPKAAAARPEQSPACTPPTSARFSVCGRSAAATKYSICDLRCSARCMTRSPLAPGEMPSDSVRGPRRRRQEPGHHETLPTWPGTADDAGPAGACTARSPCAPQRRSSARARNERSSTLPTAAGASMENRDANLGPILRTAVASVRITRGMKGENRSLRLCTNASCAVHARIRTLEDRLRRAGVSAD